MWDASRSASLYQKIYDVVRKIPKRRVATYGQIADLVGPPCTARTVGWALAALDRFPQAVPVPWQRVISSQGTVSTSPRQRALLLREGIELDPQGRIDLTRYLWEG